MKKKNILIIILSAVVVLTVVGLFLICYAPKERALMESGGITKEVYYCAMHPDFTSEKPGNCMVCGMILVKKIFSKPEKTTAAKEKKIIFYRNPMNPEVTSPVPMKDSMGMDYTPVYTEETGGGTAGIHISPERQQLIGVTKEKIEKRHLINQIFTVGEIAYDPDLYVAQEEYLQALKTVTTTKNSALTSVTEQSKSLLEASGKKLLLLGMSKAQIEELAKRGSAEESLYLPVNSDSVWAYMTIYEYEIGLITEGVPVEINAVAFPGELFKGKITSITPVVNAETRAIRVRAEINNPQHKLKSRMFVNAKINIDLGEKLVVPETAVIDTGARKIVYVVKRDDTFTPREVTLGQKALEYFEVLDGLKDGDIVVTSGNFLVDSESKLKATPGSSSGHKPE